VGEFWRAEERKRKKKKRGNREREKEKKREKREKREKRKGKKGNKFLFMEDQGNQQDKGGNMEQEGQGEKEGENFNKQDPKETLWREGEKEEWMDRIGRILWEIRLVREEPSEILPDLFLGGIESAFNPSRLKALQITHILNCAGREIGTEPSFYAGEFVYHSIEASDSFDFPIVPAYAEECLEFALKAEEAKGGLLLHCRAGMNRSAAICILIVMERKGISLLEALQLVFDKRPMILSNEGFREQLLDYAKRRKLLKAS